MTLKEYQKKFKRAIARYVMVVCAWLARHLPFPCIKSIMSFVAIVCTPLMVRLRRIARDSLEIAFGKEKDLKERNKIMEDCFKGFSQAIGELLYYQEHPGEVSRQYSSIEGKENLDAALAQGKGAIAVTAHFGNFALMLLQFVSLGYKVNVIMRRIRDEKVGAHALHVMTKVGVNTIFSMPRRECVVNSIKRLRENEILVILLDQHFGGDGGVFVDFFGKKAATATGPMVFSSRTGAPIIPIFNIRENDGRYKIVIEPPLEIEEHEDEEAKTIINISKITKIIERYVREYPHLWGWMHCRWKTCSESVQASVALEENKT